MSSHTRNFWQCHNRDSELQRRRRRVSEGKLLSARRAQLPRRPVRKSRPRPESIGRKFVFRGAKPGRPLSNMAMLELIRRMNAEREVVGLPKWTDPRQGDREVVPHGFRSSFRDWAVEKTNFTREVAEAALAHVNGDETERA
jgi:integrase